MGDKIDDAFDWLILIVGTMNGVLIGLPEDVEAKKALTGGIILAFFVLVMVWLLSHLTKRERLKITLKMYAWFYALFMLEMFVWLFFEQTYGLMMNLSIHVFSVFPPLTFLFLALFFAVPFLFFDQLVRPEYREIYRNSSLLKNRKLLALLCVFAFATFIVQILPSILLGAFIPH